MTRYTSQLLLICLVLVALLSNGCSSSPSKQKENAAISTPTPPSSPPAVPLSAAPMVLARPVSKDGIELVVTDVREAGLLSSKSSSSFAPSSLTGFPSDNTTQYSPKNGYTFLVVDTLFRNLDTSLGVIKASSEKACLIDSSGKVFNAKGAGAERSTGLLSETSPKEKDFCVDCKYSIEKQISRKNTIELPISFVFVMKEGTINKTFKFRYGKMPPIEFVLNKPR
jgi:hypothetical protein